MNRSMKEQLNALLRDQPQLLAATSARAWAQIKQAIPEAKETKRESILAQFRNIRKGQKKPSEAAKTAEPSDHHSDTDEKIATLVSAIVHRTLAGSVVIAAREVREAALSAGLKLTITQHVVDKVRDALPDALRTMAENMFKPAELVPTYVVDLSKAAPLDLLYELASRPEFVRALTAPDFTPLYVAPPAPVPAIVPSAHRTAKAYPVHVLVVGVHSKTEFEKRTAMAALIKNRQVNLSYSEIHSGLNLTQYDAVIVRSPAAETRVRTLLRGVIRPGNRRPTHVYCAPNGIGPVENSICVAVQTVQSQRAKDMLSAALPR